LPQPEPRTWQLKTSYAPCPIHEMQCYTGIQSYQSYKKNLCGNITTLEMVTEERIFLIRITPQRTTSIKFIIHLKH